MNIKMFVILVIEMESWLLGLEDVVWLEANDVL